MTFFSSQQLPSQQLPSQQLQQQAQEQQQDVVSGDQYRYALTNFVRFPNAWLKNWVDQGVCMYSSVLLMRKSSNSGSSWRSRNGK